MAKAGRPRVNSEAVNVRLLEEVKTALDAYRKDQVDLPTRPEGVRRLIVEALKEKGYLPK
ncbi:hypothetical protein D4A92_00275 [Rhizobium rosettiformans]|uniref:CopG family transcriptional regulator n=1 Tax=Rhizobium rosettiformans TaxID=1368430 RepID=A0ABX7EPX2_9HYPH|nr:hypothetical protein [Rhizobium rosettiformans]QRF49988.1 hypothetical protein D4A92_00275 [Rhizobium rosettiformans]